MAQKNPNKSIAVLEKKYDKVKSLLVKNSAIMSRMRLASQLGMTHDGARNLFKEFGYKETLTTNDYVQMFERNGVARRVITKPVKDSWRKLPTITDDVSDETETSFEKAINSFFKQNKVFPTLKNLDILSGIGRFGILVFGFGDSKLDTPAPKNSELVFLRPYSEASVEISDFETDVSNPRFGLPLYYSIKFELPDGHMSIEKKVHWTRVLHISEEALDNEVYGNPRLKSVYNYLEDLLKVSGGAGEMFYRGAKPRMALTADQDAEFDRTDLEDLDQELTEWEHEMRAALRLQGVTVHEFNQVAIDPRGHVDVLVQLISASTGIPARILMGSERGELASSQDSRNWLEQVDERRRNQVENGILRPFIAKCVELGFLPKPDEDYSVIWPDMLIKDSKEQADISKTKTEALVAYCESRSAVTSIPIELYLRDFLGIEQHKIDQYKHQREKEWEEELEREEEDMNNFTQNPPAAQVPKPAPVKAVK
jgi:hypothetical protein